jgi:hypothetical protein
VRAWGGPAGLAILVLAGTCGAAGAERPALPSGAEVGEAVDAEMLRDLDLLLSPQFAREREMSLRMPFLERLRLLEGPRGPEPLSRRAPEPAGGVPKVRP